MVITITKNEYRILKTEVKELREKLERFERLFKDARRKAKEEEILTLAGEAEKLAKEGKLAELKSLKELR